MPIIEIVLTAVITVLVEKLATFNLLKFAGSQEILTQVTKLRNVLRTIQAVLNDAETKQIRDEAMNQWLAELRDLAYDVTGEICFRREDYMDSNERCNISPKARHSAFMPYDYEVYKRFKAFDHELLRLRTFLALPTNRRHYYLSNGVLVNILSKLLGGLGLSHLNNLELLREMISIVGLQNVTNVRDAKETNLNRKQDLDDLELLWSIEFYKGLTFPSWIGDLSFAKTTQISLRGCTKCAYLPPLGQLPLVQELHIQGLNAVKNVCAEFYGDGSTLETRFPSLETLCFEDMPEWKEWCSYIGAEFLGHFSCLRQLTMSNCPKLEEFTHFLVSLENFEVCTCAALVTLWQKGNAPQHLSNLQHLSVEGCSELVCLTEEDQMLPCNLESLQVYGCDCLERFPNGLESHTSLKVLKLIKCPKLVSFPEANLPPMLRSLLLKDCSSLESLPNCNSCLEELCLKECSSLRSLPVDTLSSTLKSLEIRNCKELESILEPIRLNIIMEEPGCFRISDWPNLEKLFVSIRPFYCELSYKMGQPFSTGSSLLTPNLTSLFIGGIANDIYFASKFQSLTSLEYLWMYYCDNLESFPQENLPPNLAQIAIINCKKLKPLSEFGLHRLSSL
ncbi:unnamed protein product [Ilex paraguariensis]|uniref:Rx N-terminal domain-containing protein n=1 Tax=Ilex paraguariensis TaxID=185542 RepID=A0ABC8SPH9_9AQUA